MSRLNLTFLIAFIGLLIWITLFDPGAISTIQRGAQQVMRPFMKASGTVDLTAGEMGGETIGIPQLRSRLAAAEQERDRLKLEVIQLDELLDENNELRKALQYRERSPRSLVAARVISRKPSQWYNTLIIDKGGEAGIEVDSPVIVPLGDEAGLVGKVSEVIGPESAVVLLLTDEMCQVSAKLGETQEQGILSGQRGAFRHLPNLRLRYLSKEVETVPGTRIYSSGTGELFPPDLYLGDVLGLSRGVIDAEASVKPAVDFDKLTDLFIILPAEREDQATSDPPAEKIPEKPVSAP